MKMGGLQPRKVVRWI